MMREEFEKLLPVGIPYDLTDMEYRQIEFVYTFHPLNLSKEDTAYLYAKFGFGIFNDLLENAKQAAAYDQAVDDARLQLDRACGERETFKKKYQGIYIRKEGVNHE